MRKLNINNSLTTDQAVILAVQKHFYQDLYTSRNKCCKNTAVETFLMNLDIPKLTDEQKDSCEGKIHQEECKSILDSFRIIKPQGATASRLNFIKGVGP